MVWNPESKELKSRIQMLGSGIGWDPESRTFVDSLTRAMLYCKDSYMMNCAPDQQPQHKVSLFSFQISIGLQACLQVGRLKDEGRLVFCLASYADVRLVTQSFLPQEERLRDEP